MQLDNRFIQQADKRQKVLITAWQLCYWPKLPDYDLRPEKYTKKSVA